MSLEKTLLVLTALLLLGLALASCAGPEGSAGPAGPEGPAGEAGSAEVAEMPVFGADYIGSAACGECHEQTYDVFMQSGHPYKLNAVVDGQPPTYPFTKGCSVLEYSFVIKDVFKLHTVSVEFIANVFNIIFS